MNYVPMSEEMLTDVSLHKFLFWAAFIQIRPLREGNANSYKTLLGSERKTNFQFRQKVLLLN